MKIPDVVAMSFDLTLESSIITQELNSISEINRDLKFSTIYLQNLIQTNDYATVANYDPSNAVESYLTIKCKIFSKYPKKLITNYLKNEIIERDCDFLRLLYCDISRDIQILKDLKKSNITYCWEYWVLFISLIEDISDLEILKSHKFYPIAVGYAGVTRNLKILNIEAILAALQEFKIDFTDTILILLEFIYNKVDRLDDREQILNSKYLSDFSHYLCNELSKKDDVDGIQMLSMQLSLEDPLHFGTLITQAIYYSLKDMNLKSIELFQKSLGYQPTVLANLLLGHEYFQFGNYKKAVNCYLNVVKLNRLDVRGWASLADTNLSMGLFDQAIRYYSECAKINQDDPYIYKSMGDCYEKLENPQMWYQSTLSAWKLSPTGENTLALYQSAKAFGLGNLKVYEILKKAFLEDSSSLEFSLLVELVDHAILASEIAFAKNIFNVAKDQAGWMHQAKLIELESKLSFRPQPDVQHSPIRNKPVISDYSDQYEASVCNETPTRGGSQSFGFELGR
eukprot:NODE_576_length_5827_cov_0.654853.p1 type:complete len:511 gc:universal NODE_576_length_5827_cov_0.654853:2712-1180(-)